MRVSVIVPPNAADSRRLLASLDRQTMPTAEFEVLVGDDEGDPSLTARLDDLVAHRTNLVRVPVAPGADVAAVLLEQARGEYVLAVPAGRTLRPQALALLSGQADATGADVCLGLTGRAGSRPERLPTTPGQLAGPAAGLRRRSATDSGQVADDLAGKDATTDGAAAVATSLCFVDGSVPKKAVPPGPTTARATSVAWRDGVLEVVVELAEAAATVGASVYSHQTGVEWALEDVHADGTRLTVRIDPKAVPGAGRLPDGLWWPTLRLGDRALLIAAGPQIAHGATLRDRIVVSFSDGKRLGLDVGGLTHQPVRRLDPAATTVVEDSRGSLLTSRLTNIDLAPGARVTGQLRLDKMPVVAWLEDVAGTGPALRAWVSGLAGESTLHTRFGKAPFAATGAHLVIDGVGTMTVAPIPPKPAPGPGANPPASSAPHGPVARSRRLAGRALRKVRR